MSYHSIRKTRLQNRLTKVQAALDKLYDTQTAMAGYENSDYSFSSGEGQQRTSRYNPLDISKNINELEAKEAHLINELSCMGLVTIRLRRKS